jgi:dTDP-4-dehydrorhamnose reductase
MQNTPYNFISKINQTMKVLIYGYKGWIGSQFTKLLDSHNIIYSEGKARVDNIEDVISELLETSPTHVVSFIGRTHGKIDEKIYTTIDYLEQPNKLQDNIRDNLFSPLVLAFLCKKLNIHLTYLGTGCIFKYDKEHPFGQETNGFTENSLPNFFGSSYSTVKGFTDQLMKFFDDTVLNVRIRMPISGEYNTRNFITKITTYDKICSIPNSMTVLPELLPKVLDMMKKCIIGTINLTNPGLISHDEILDMYKRIVDPTFRWKNFSEKQQRLILDSDRSNNFLDTHKLQQMYPDVKNIKESIENVLVLYKENLLKM